MASHRFSCTQYFTGLAFLCSNIYLPCFEQLRAGGQEVRGALQHAGLLQARLCPGGEAEEVEGGGHRQTSRILHRGPGIASKASDSVLHIADCV